VKIILTADLHFHRPWFNWLLRAADRFELVCVAGDFLDMYRREGMVPQLIFLYEWAQAFARRPAYLALCTGNHDLSPGVPLLAPHSPLGKEKFSILAEYAKRPHWLQAVKLNHQIVVDGDNKIVRVKSGQSLMVSCCAYRGDGSVEIREVLAEPWLVLHHEPPAYPSVAEPKAGNTQFAKAVERLQPTYTISGHVHLTDKDEKRFFEKIGTTYCFSCRQTPPAEKLPPEPNIIMLDTSRREATWRRWIDTKRPREVKVAL
jgi:calcineurin-like phosphoesterase family protein